MSAPEPAAVTLDDAHRRRADRARQVADALRRQVLHGQFPDRAVPSESQLVAEFGASRNTVRDALDLLRAEGLIDRCPGVGTMVTADKHPHGLEHLLGLGETLHGRGVVTNEVRAAGPIVAPLPVGARLGLPEGTPVVYLERLRHLDGVPLSLDLTYLDHDLGRAVLAEDLAHTDVFVLLERLSGQRLGRAELAVDAVAADPHSAAVLGVGRGAPLLMVERVTHLDDDRPVDLEFIRFRGDAATFSAGLRDADEAVRLQAMRGAVALGDTDGVLAAAGDPARVVRVAAARGLGSVASTRPDRIVDALSRLAGDDDPLVRAAALAAAAKVDCRGPLAELALAALGDPAWEVRAGAVQGLAAAPDLAVDPLVTALDDPHLDVRKAAVIALARWVDRAEVAAALARARDDRDADVRAHARRALTMASRMGRA